MADWLKVVEEVLERNEQSERTLETTFDALSALAINRPAQLRVAGTSIYGSDVRFDDQQGAPYWVERLLEQKGATGDARYQVAVLMSQLTGDPEIALVFLDACLKEALANNDLSRLRELRAACVASLLRPQILSSIGGPSRKAKLAACANSALAHIHARLNEDSGLISAADYEKSQEMRILLVIAWVPANVDYGAHLRQLCSYALGLILAGRASKRIVRVKVVFTYDTATTGLIQNFQGYAAPAEAAIAGAFKNALGEHSQFVELVHLHPSRFQALGAWVRKVQDVAIEFKADVALRWFGFYGSDIVIPFIHRLVPVMGIQFNATNPVDRHADILLNQGPLSADKKAADPRWREHRIPLEVLPKRLTRSRADFDLSDDRDYLVSVLSGGRLEAALRSLGETEFQDICDLLNQYPDTDWLLVGVQNIADLQGLHDRFDALLDAGRVRSFPFVDDLRSLYPHCKAMLHLPKMQGGGMGVAMAVEDGLPICAHAGTDPENFLHPDWIARDWPTYTGFIRQVLQSGDFSRRVSDAHKDWMTKMHGLEAVGFELMELSEQARGLWVCGSQHGVGRSAAFRGNEIGEPKYG